MAITWLKMFQISQVGGVLESSGPPLEDGHRDFEDWCILGWGIHENRWASCSKMETRILKIDGEMPEINECKVGKPQMNWCLLSMVFDCWIVSAILSLNQSGYGFPKPSWTQEPSSNGIVLMAVLQYGGQTAVVQRYFVNSHILHTFNIQWVEFNIVNT